MCARPACCCTLHRRNYPSQCDRILKAFHCHTMIDGTSLLWADSSVQCGDHYNGTVGIAAAFFLLVYGFGVPLIFWWRLRHFAGVRHMKKPMMQLGFMYACARGLARGLAGTTRSNCRLLVCACGGPHTFPGTPS